MDWTEKSIEIIIVDDDSKDSTASIMDKLAAEDNSVKVLHQDNTGVSTTRNAGLEAASGEFVVFIISDDCIAPSFLTYMLNLIKKNGEEQV